MGTCGVEIFWCIAGGLALARQKYWQIRRPQRRTRDTYALQLQDLKTTSNGVVKLVHICWYFWCARDGGERDVNTKGEKVLRRNVTMYCW